tara:strand:- start:240 stop:458 length:219 start_codon:yes stop_codon:yes gene_type:complete
LIEVWKPRPPFDVLTEIAELIENLTETNANMAMLRSGGDLEVTGFLTIDHVTFHPSRTTPIDFILVILSFLV